MRALRAARRVRGVPSGRWLNQPKRTKATRELRVFGRLREP